MWGISGRLNNTPQVPAPRAFVSDQTGLVEERRDGRDLSHLCCFASRTQQGSGGALTRHRLLHGGAPFRFVCTPLTFQRSYSALVANACASGQRSRRARETRPSTIVREHVGNRHRLRVVLDAAWEMGLAARHCTLVIADGARPHQQPRHRRAASPSLEQRRSLRRPTWVDTYLLDRRRHRGHSRCMCLAPAFRASRRRPSGVLPETSASDQINKVVHDIWVALSLWARETIDGYFSARIRDFLLAPKFTRLFSSCIRGGTRPR
jgi:hypothetical protein